MYYIANTKIISEDNILPEQFSCKDLYNYVISIKAVDTAFHDTGVEIYSSHGMSVSSSEEGMTISVSQGKESVSIVCDNSYNKLTVYGLGKHIDTESAMYEYFMQIFRTAVELSFAYHNRIVVHASFIIYHDKAILFLAPSGTGKSTQASLWNKVTGAEIASGDRPVIFCDREGLFGVSGKIYACGVPWDGKEKIYRQVTVPLVAIIELRQSNSNFVRELDKKQSMSLLMRQCFMPMWDQEATQCVMETFTDVAAHIPCYRYHCLPDESSVTFLHDFLFKDIKNNIIKAGADMQIKPGFVLRDIAGEHIVIPAGDNINVYEGSIILNDTGAYIWKILEKPTSFEELIKYMLEEFDVSMEAASADAEEFISKIQTLKALTV